MDAFADPDFVRDELEQRGDEPRRIPHAGERIWIHGDRRTVLTVTVDRVIADDEAGFQQSRRRDLLWWDGAAWRTWADR